MLLTFNFNLNTGDTSGLPTTQLDFLRWFRDKPLVSFCINADHARPFNRSVSIDGNHILIEWCIPDFFERFHSEVVYDISEVIEQYKVDTILKPDYLIEEYLRAVRVNHPVREIMFVHMLWRGLFNTIMQMPNFLDGGLYRGSEEYAKKVHWEGIALNHSHEIICNSQFTYSDLQRYYRIMGRKVHCLPLGIFLDDYKYQPSLENRKVCYFGRLDSQKGMHWIFRDFVDRKEWWQKNPLIVLGEGAYESNICRAMREGLVDFHWAVPKNEMREILSTVKYCVFPSVYEPYCLALNEALAMGKVCLVSSTGGGMLEQVEDGKNGFVVDFWYSFLSDYIDKLEFELTEQNFAQITLAARKSARNVADHLNGLGKILWSNG